LRPGRLLAEVVMARQPEVFVRALEPAEAQRALVEKIDSGEIDAEPVRSYPR
jgi:hypothetical protein